MLFNFLKAKRKLKAIETADVKTQDQPVKTAQRGTTPLHGETPSFLGSGLLRDGTRIDSFFQPRDSPLNLKSFLLKQPDQRPI